MGKNSGNRLKYPVHTLEKSLEVIELLSKKTDGSGMGISELSRNLNLGKSTVHRILTTLMAYGYAGKVPNTTNYRLDWKLYEIGTIVLQQRDLNNFDLSILQRICDKHKETVNIGILANKHVVILNKAEPSTTLIANLRIGSREPFYATALGKVLTSELEDDKLAEICRDMEFKKFTPKTIGSYEELVAELKKVREEGYAIDEEEFCLGVSCIAMPVRNIKKEIVAAISVTGPSVRLNFSKIIEIKEDLALATMELSEYLGYKTES